MRQKVQAKPSSFVKFNIENYLNVSVKKVQKLPHIVGRILIAYKMWVKIDFFNTH